MEEPRSGGLLSGLLLELGAAMASCGNDDISLDDVSKSLKGTGKGHNDCRWLS